MTTTYTGEVHSNGQWHNVADADLSFDGVLDECVSPLWDDAPFRIVRLDWDVETGALECARDVTDEAVETIKARSEVRGFDLPAWMMEAA